QLLDLAGLDLRLLLDLELLALPLAGVVLDVALARQIAAEPHRDRAGHDLGQTGGDDHRGRIDRSREPGGPRAGHSGAIGQPYDGVADHETRGEVLLHVRRVWHRSSPAERRTGRRARSCYSGRMKTYLAVFASVLVAELGDKTQIATLLYATDPGTGKLG